MDFYELLGLYASTHSSQVFASEFSDPIKYAIICAHGYVVLDSLAVKYLGVPLLSSNKEHLYGVREQICFKNQQLDKQAPSMQDKFRLSKAFSSHSKSIGHLFQRVLLRLDN